jgi:heme-degrading monooxygenase HmoA
MYIAMFIFDPGERDAEFQRLNELIDEAARATGGLIGQESWCEANGTRINATYYWETLDALKKFSSHPTHLEAKRQYRRWYEGYHVVVAEVLNSYGDEAFEHLTSNRRHKAVR